MSNLAQLVLENIIAGKVDKEIGIEILKHLKSGAEKSVKDIAIIGMSGRFPMADCIDEFWKNICNGVDCVGEFPENRKIDSDNLRMFTHLKETEGRYCQGGYLKEIDKFDCAFFKLSPKEACLMDPSQRLFLEIAWETLEDGGYGGRKAEGSRTGIYVGYNSWPIYGQIVSAVEPESSSDSMVGNLSSIIPARIAYLLDLKGPAILVDTACSSSLVALHLACQAIKNGECEMAIAGGVNIRMFPLVGEGDLGTDSYDYKTKTFDENSDGTVWGEGVAAILVKPLEHALRDGDNIYAVIKGSAVNQDGRSIGITAPNVAAQEDMLLKAWENAGIGPEAISYIEAHGTGTKLGDSIEIDGINRAFKRYTSKRHFCAIGSVKTNIGHLDSVSGISGLIKAVMSLKNKEIPPSLHFNMPNHKIDFIKSPVYVNTEHSKWETDALPRMCGINSFGLSGTNCHVVLEEAPEIKGAAGCNGRKVHVLTFSAKSISSLKILISAYKDFAERAQDIPLEDICFTANTGRGHYNYRVALILTDIGDLYIKLCEIDPDNMVNENKNGVYCGKYEIIPESKTDRDTWEITDNELLEYDEKAEEFVTEYLENRKDDIDVIENICMLYIKGASIDWSQIYGKGKVVRLPVYPFERKRCWVEVSEKQQAGLPERLEDMYYEPGWQCMEQPSNTDGAGSGSMLFIKKDGCLGEEVVSRLKSEGRRVIEAEMGDSFARVSQSKYVIDGSLENYNLLFNTIKYEGITQIVHFTAVNFKRDIESMDALEEHLKTGAYNLFHLLKGIHYSEIKDNLELVIVSNNINEVEGNESIFPENGVLAGLGKVVSLENVYMKCRCIDIDESVNADHIVSELKADFDRFFVAYRNGRRYAEEMRKLDTSKYEHDGFALNEDGVYVITGGMGGIGLEVSKLLARKARINLAFLNRSSMPDRGEWDEILSSGSHKKLCEKIYSISEIEQNGSKVTCFSADVSDLADVEGVFCELRSKFGKINGIIHGAGVAGNGFIINKDEKVFRSILMPKVYGTWILDHVTKDDRLDFFMMFSSGTSMFGDAGQGDYMAANAYLDSFVSYRKSLGKRTITINWTGWKETGMAKDNNANIDATFVSMPTNKAINAFSYILDRRVSRVLIGELNYSNENLQDLTLLNLPFELSDDIINDIKKRKMTGFTGKGKKVKTEVLLKGNNSGIYSDIEKEIAQIWGEILGFDEMNVYSNFYEMGGDSIKAVQILVRFKKYRLDVKDIFQYPTIASLHQYISASGKSSENTGDAESAFIEERKKTDFAGYDFRQLEEFNDAVNLIEIKPFNDILFKDCFYNAFFSIVKYFNRDITPFLINDFAVYSYDSGKNGIRIGIDYTSIKDTNHILDELGMKAETRMVSSDPIYDIHSAISRGNPAIIRVDCFSEPVRIDTFNAIHWSHSLLVHGYDKLKKEFSVMEQENMNSLSYKVKSISYCDMGKAYEGYLDNFHKNISIPTFYEFSVCKDNQNPISNPDYRKVFLNNLSAVKDVLYESLESLSKFKEDFIEINKNRQAMELSLDELLYQFNEIVKVKYSEKYKITLLAMHNWEEMIKILDVIVDCYTYIKSTLGMYKYSNQHRERFLKPLTEKMEQIMEAESLYLRKLFECKI